MHMPQFRTGHRGTAPSGRGSSAAATPNRSHRTVIYPDQSFVSNRAHWQQGDFAYLSDPYGLVVLGRDARNVALVVRDVRGRVVDMDRNGINCAAGARGDEVVQPCGAHRGRPIGNGGRNQLRLACERLYVCLPCLRRCLRAQVGLGVEVRLVESTARMI